MGKHRTSFADFSAVNKLKKDSNENESSLEDEESFE